jgi:hypothetical protein
MVADAYSHYCVSFVRFYLTDWSFASNFVEGWLVVAVLWHWLWWPSWVGQVVSTFIVVLSFCDLKFSANAFIQLDHVCEATRCYRGACIAMLCGWPMARAGLMRSPTTRVPKPLPLACPADRWDYDTQMIGVNR